MARPRNDDRVLEEGRVGESVGLLIQPKHHLWCSTGLLIEDQA